MSEHAPESVERQVLRNRVDEAEYFAYASLYRAASDEIGSRVLHHDNTFIVLSPADESAGFSGVLGFERATDRDETWAFAAENARETGVPCLGMPVPAELLPWATPDKLASCGVVYDFEEIVWHLPIDEWPTELPALPEGMTVVVDAVDPHRFAETINRGWDLPADHSRGRLYTSCIGQPGWRYYQVNSGDDIAAVGAMAYLNGTTAIHIGVVDPAFRGQGLQSYLIARRLLDARLLGCDLAMAETMEDGASAANLRKQGFQVLYRRPIYTLTLGNS